MERGERGRRTPVLTLSPFAAWWWTVVLAGSAVIAVVVRGVDTDGLAHLDAGLWWPSG